MKTFKDLEFKPHKLSVGAENLPETIQESYLNAKQAVMEFENGYGVSVLLGSCFYSNGIDTYEVGILHNGSLCYSTPITNDVIGRISEEEVSEIMIEVQKLEK